MRQIFVPQKEIGFLDKLCEPQSKGILGYGYENRPSRGPWLLRSVGRIDKCPRWSTLWVNPISPGREQAWPSKFKVPTGQSLLAGGFRGNILVRSMSWFAVNSFRGRWETILPWRVVATLPLGRDETAEVDVSHLNCLISLSLSLYAVVGHLPNAAEEASPVSKILLEGVNGDPITTAQARSAIQVPLGNQAFLVNHSQTLELLPDPGHWVRCLPSS